MKPKSLITISAILLVITGCASYKQTPVITPPAKVSAPTPTPIEERPTVVAPTINTSITVNNLQQPDSTTNNNILTPTQPNESATSTPVKPAVVTPPAPVIKTFNITAKQFEFIPSTITVNKGDKVKINITSQDVNHGFTIAEFGVSETLSPNETKTVEFTADKIGTFSMFCSVYCGAGHGGMKGSLIIK